MSFPAHSAAPFAQNQPPVSPAAKYKSSLPAKLAVFVILLGSLAYGYSLDRYPAFYVDDVVFAYPALQAAQGGAFAYPGGGNAPYRDELWAYHGPVLPNLEIVLFKLFGYTFFLSRLVDFLGAWSAALLLVLYLNRRRYRYAGLIFAVLWCGDRAVQETMYNRMDGLALLVLVLLFLSVEQVWRTNSPRRAFLAGLLGGFSVLVHPLCMAFAVAAFALIAFRKAWTALGRYCLGGLLNLPILLVLWHFHPVKSWIQFHAVASELNRITGVSRLQNLIHVLQWSRYWFIALAILAFACTAAAIAALLRRTPLTYAGTDLVLASAFCCAGLVLLARSSFYPYYLVYFSVWPMLCACILTERYRTRFLPVAAVLALVWSPSAVWNLLRLREPVKFYSALNHRFVSNEIRRDVPQDSTIVTSSELYAVPIEAGLTHRGLLSFDPMQQDACHACYLLITEAIFENARFVPRSNLDARKILYRGPAFPGAGPLAYPIVLLSPE